MDVIITFDDSKLDQGLVEKALNPNGRVRRVGSGSDLTTGKRDVHYSYASRKTADRAIARVRRMAKRHHVRLRVEVS